MNVEIWQFLLFAGYTVSGIWVYQQNQYVEGVTDNLNHHLYADNTQLFSFLPRNFVSSIAQTALQQISSWMFANLTVNFSKTEFLIFGLRKQLSKIDNYLIQLTLSATLVLFLTHNSKWLGK